MAERKGKIDPYIAKISEAVKLPHVFGVILLVPLVNPTNGEDTGRCEEVTIPIDHLSTIQLYYIYIYLTDPQSLDKGPFYKIDKTRRNLMISSSYLEDLGLLRNTRKRAPWDLRKGKKEMGDEKAHERTPQKIKPEVKAIIQKIMAEDAKIHQHKKPLRLKRSK